MSVNSCKAFPGELEIACCVPPRLPSWITQILRGKREADCCVCGRETVSRKASSHRSQKYDGTRFASKNHINFDVN